MPSVWYNTFFEWVQQDDIIASNEWILEAKNIDWNRTGYWVTIWPKTNKQVATNVPIYATSDFWPDQIFIWHDWTKAEIYLDTDTDLTPSATIDWTSLDNNWNTTNYWRFETIMRFDWQFYVTGRDSGNNVQVHRIRDTDPVTSDNWEFDLLSSPIVWKNIPVIHTDWASIYFWIGWTITVTSWGSYPISFTNFAIFNQTITWISRHWTQFYVHQYSDTYGGRVSLWDWETAAVSANIDLWFQPTRTTSKAWNDFITTSDWEFYAWSGYQFQKLLSPKKTIRGLDNSWYVDKIDFTYYLEQDQTERVNIALQQVQWDIYWITNDTTKWIYKYWNLIEWLTPSLHKIVWTNYNWDTISEIYSSYYNQQTKKYYYTYKSWTSYLVDYIDLDSLETAQDWSFVTQIFRWPPEKVIKIKEIRLTTSYTSWDNYIKLSRRLDNWSWEEVRTINDSTDTIVRHRITNNQNKEFTDIQFKIELHNNLQTNTPPILHGLELIYTINKE